MRSMVLPRGGTLPSRVLSNTAKRTPVQRRNYYFSTAAAASSQMPIIDKEQSKWPLKNLAFAAGVVAVVASASMNEKHSQSPHSGNCDAPTSTLPDALQRSDENTTAEAEGSGMIPKSSRWWKERVYSTLGPRKLIGNYENRLKRFATPEKIFEYFANEYDETTKRLYMSKSDFFDSLLPYTFFSNESCDGGGERNVNGHETSDDDAHLHLLHSSASSRPRCPLEGRNKTSCSSWTLLRWFFPIKESSAPPPSPPSEYRDLFALADSDKDGKLSFEEYLFFLTLLSTSLTQFELAFRLFGTAGSFESPAATYTEFVEIMTRLLRLSPRGGQFRSASLAPPPSAPEVMKATALSANPVMASDSPSLPSTASIPDGRSVRSNLSSAGVVEACLAGPLGDGLFGHDRCSPLSWHEFQEMLAYLKEELLFVEFTRAGTPQGAGRDTFIAAGEFARLLVGFVKPSRMEKLADRIRTLYFDPCEAVTFHEFQAFHECIRRIDALRAAVRLKCSGDGITRVCLRDTLSALTKCPRTDFSTLADVVFKVFDVDGNGRLDSEEFLHLVQQRRLSCMGLENEETGKWAEIRRALQQLWHALSHP